jgi:DNA-binding transcriptional LysR family regulator
MNMHQLRVFLEVAETGSFSAASEKLYLTQPAVTLQIKNLEEYYQMKFFERIGKKILLTEEGKVLLDIAKQILDLNRQAEEMLADLKGLSKGTVRVATAHSFADYYLPAVLKNFHKKHPKIFIQISTGNTEQIIEDTLAYKNDIAFVARNPESDKLIAREVVSDVLVAIIPTKHKLAVRESVTLNELNGEPLIVREQGSSERRLVDQAFRFRRIQPLIIMESASTAAIQKMVRTGAGIGILGEHLVRREVEADAFKAIRFTEVEMAHKFYLVYHKEKYFSRALKAFLEVAMDLSGKLNNA